MLGGQNPSEGSLGEECIGSGRLGISEGVQGPRIRGAKRQRQNQGHPSVGVPRALAMPAQLSPAAPSPP